MKKVKIGVSRIEEVVGEGNVGFCLNCGEEAYGVEPDARNYECESCGEKEVYGAEEIILMGEIKNGNM